ncbi:probable tRNA methyltransferase 9B [Sorex fumeus]|uniref:probable tRNA methyltransferase 9B n=1 Tax=Sorex fumeus TaxID=62283 RepID=UPI0024ACEE91|nr:probable tRNA methyltransferase 9B [Sorex fumeus]XP_055970083.1 probable tRNA methyltransferase 9B [Sorex fumeus]
MDHEAAQLEQQHVHAVYESTAPYFSDLQSKAWPRVRQFLQEQKPGSLVADIGCGTGKYLKVNSQVHSLGCDYCGPLVEIARSRGCEVMVCDNLNLPFRDQGFDAIISIGVIHHFSTKQRRIRAIKEMARILVPGGQLMIYVWAMEQKNRHFEKQDVLVPWNRALCSRLLAEPSRSMREQQAQPERRQPCPRPCTHWTRASSLQERRDSKRCHSVDSGPVATTNCCASVSKTGEGENGFYNTLERSFRSWFSSRSFDESTLRKQFVERARALTGTEGWAPTRAVSTQPCRHASLDLAHPGPVEPTLDEDVFVEASGKHLEWPSAPAATRSLQGDGPDAVKRNGDARFLEGSGPRGASAKAGDAEGDPPAGQRLTRVSAVHSTVSNPGGPSREQQRPESWETTAFMRYYHVFCEGELCELLTQHVSELRILSSGNDHGNWCLVAEKIAKRHCE